MINQLNEFIDSEQILYAELEFSAGSFHDDIKISGAKFKGGQNNKFDEFIDSEKICTPNLNLVPVLFMMIQHYTK